MNTKMSILAMMSRAMYFTQAVVVSGYHGDLEYNRKFTETIYHNLGKLIEIPEHVPRNITREAEESIEWVIARMRVHVRGLEYEGHDFETSAAELHKYIAEVGNWIENVFPTNRELHTRLDFARTLYSKLDEAASFLKFYGVHALDQHLVRFLVQLNVRLLTMHTPMGIPDVNMKGYAKYVYGYEVFLHSWGEIFVNLKVVPLSVRLMFGRQYTEASSMLHKMAGYIRG